jgi:hypothetical protein
MPMPITFGRPVEVAQAPVNVLDPAHPAGIDDRHTPEISGD